VVDSHHRRGRLALLAATAIVAALAAVSGASGATTCTGTITSGSFGSIVVPPGANCELNAENGDIIEVTGSISVGQGASLQVFAGGLLGFPCGQILIHGSVAATSPQTITFFADPGCTLRVDGSISIRGATELVEFQNVSVGGSVTLRDNPASNSVRLQGSTIDGSVTVSNNTVSNNVLVSSNSIGGSLTFSNNSGNTVFVAENMIGGSLACSDNNGLTNETFGPNTVGGSTSGQCATV
jgi:hypothetical protein